MPKTPDFLLDPPSFSFELFPPKNDEAEKDLKKELKQLALLNPRFISVTMGAMGSSHGKTFELVEELQKEYGITGVAHLTCVASSKEDILKKLDELSRRQINQILCLRGDPPKGSQNFVPPKDGFQFASELVAFVREKTADQFSIGVAGYPETHIESKKNPEADLIHLKEKIDAGADYILTQLFFENSHFFDFLEKTRRIGIEIPIIPGILPILNTDQLKIFTQMCGASIPQNLEESLKSLKPDEPVWKFGVRYAAAQCQKLLANQVSGIHFYTLNRALSVKKILEGLNLKR